MSQTGGKYTTPWYSLGGLIVVQVFLLYVCVLLFEHIKYTYLYVQLIWHIHTYKT